jgi:hypothetical protein
MKLDRCHTEMQVVGNSKHESYFLNRLGIFTLIPFQRYLIITLIFHMSVTRSYMQCPGHGAYAYLQASRLHPLTQQNASQRLTLDSKLPLLALEKSQRRLPIRRRRGT